MIRFEESLQGLPIRILPNMTGGIILYKTQKNAGRIASRVYILLHSRFPLLLNQCSHVNDQADHRQNGIDDQREADTLEKFQPNEKSEDNCKDQQNDHKFTSLSSGNCILQNYYQVLYHEFSKKETYNLC